MKPLRMTTLLLLAVALPTFGFDDKKADFVPIVKGNDISQFELVKLDGDSMTITDGEVRLTGTPAGYFATKASYKDYTLVFDWMYERPADLKSDAAFQGNSGCLVHVVPPLKVWPKSIEVQLANADAGHIFAIDGKFKGKKDAQAQGKAIKPVGQWNHEEVTCKAGAISCKINGVLIDSGTGADPAEGRIAWQSEGGAIRFREIKIRVLKDSD